MECNTQFEYIQWTLKSLKVLRTPTVFYLPFLPPSAPKSAIYLGRACFQKLGHKSIGKSEVWQFCFKNLDFNLKNEVRINKLNFRAQIDCFEFSRFYHEHTYMLLAVSMNGLYEIE